MPIYPRHKAVFVHIPKTGGSSVTTLMKRDHFWGRKRNSTDPRGVSCQTVFELQDVMGAEFDQYFSFSFVRNPWDRFVSAYHYIEQRRPEMTSVCSHNGFSDFLSAFAACPDPYLAIRYFRPQHEYLLDCQGNTPVDFVAQYEHFERDLGTVLAKLGIRRKLMRSRKRSKRLDYRAYYDAEGRDIIADIYKRDIESFGYTYEHGSWRDTSSRLRQI